MPGLHLSTRLPGLVQRLRGPEIDQLASVLDPDNPSQIAEAGRLHQSEVKRLQREHDRLKKEIEEATTLRLSSDSCCSGLRAQSLANSRAPLRVEPLAGSRCTLGVPAGADRSTRDLIGALRPSAWWTSALDSCTSISSVSSGQCAASYPSASRKKPGRVVRRPAIRWTDGHPPRRGTSQGGPSKSGGSPHRACLPLGSERTRTSGRQCTRHIAARVHGQGIPCHCSLPGGSNGPLRRRLPTGLDLESGSPPDPSEPGAVPSRTRSTEGSPISIERLTTLTSATPPPRFESGHCGCWTTERFLAATRTTFETSAEMGAPVADCADLNAMLSH